MTAPIEYGRTDAPPQLPRWLALLLFSAATLIGIGTLWALSPSTVGCGEPGFIGGDILPGPQPCAPVDGTTPALVTSGLLLALLAAVFVVSFTLARLRGRVVLILGAGMLLVLLVGLLATVATAGSQPPVIYY
jgi:hypothetical protein